MRREFYKCCQCGIVANTNVASFQLGIGIGIGNTGNNGNIHSRFRDKNETTGGASSAACRLESRRTRLQSPLRRFSLSLPPPPAGLRKVASRAILARLPSMLWKVGVIYT